MLLTFVRVIAIILRVQTQARLDVMLIISPHLVGVMEYVVQEMCSVQYFQFNCPPPSALSSHMHSCLDFDLVIDVRECDASLN